MLDSRSMRSRSWLLASVASLVVYATSAADPQPWLAGHRRVIGCATSPGDPANCAHGDIVFDADRWSIALPCCKRAASYRVVSTAPDQIAIASELADHSSSVHLVPESEWASQGVTYEWLAQDVLHRSLSMSGELPCGIFNGEAEAKRVGDSPVLRGRHWIACRGR